MLTGVINNITGVTTGTAARIGPNAGGLPEVQIPNSGVQVTLTRVTGMNPHLGR
jgi:hypothetical protein